MESGIEFFDEETPSDNALCGIRSKFMCKIFVVCVKMNVSTKKHVAKSFESFDNAEHFKLNGSIVALSCIELARVVCHQTKTTMVIDLLWSG